MEFLDKITVTNVSHVGTVRQPTGIVTKITKRSAFALSLPIKGKIIYTHEGESHISDEGTLTLHPLGASYTLKCERGGEFIVIDFYATRYFTDRFKTFKLSRPELVIERYRALLEAHLSGSRSRTLSEFYSLINTATSDVKLAENPILAPVISYLDKSFTSPDISNSQLAKIAHVSESYVRRLFLKQYSMTPRQYVIAKRMALAKMLLSENKLTVNAVAERCGFSSVFHFCRSFKQTTGETPLSYSKKYSERKL